MAFIPALVIQQDSTLYLNSDGSYGFITQIPTPASGGRLDTDYWASPVNSQGIVGKGLKFTPCLPGDTNKPDVQSFHVVRVVSNRQSADWYLNGTSTQYNLSSYDAEIAHASTPVLMPVTVVNILPSQVICNQARATGLYTAYLGASSQLPGQKYYASGYFNGVALAPLSVIGYSTIAGLVADMNSLWSNVGAWSYYVPDGLSVFATQAAGSGTDVLTAAIVLA